MDRTRVEAIQGDSQRFPLARLHTDYNELLATSTELLISHRPLLASHRPLLATETLVHRLQSALGGVLPPRDWVPGILVCLVLTRSPAFLPL